MTAPGLAPETWSRAHGATLDFGWSRETFAWAVAQAAERGVFWGACNAREREAELARQRAVAEAEAARRAALDPFAGLAS